MHISVYCVFILNSPIVREEDDWPERDGQIEVAVVADEEGDAADEHVADGEPALVEDPRDHSVLLTHRLHH